MKQVEIIRQRIVRGQVQELRRLRSFISTTEGNLGVLQKLEGEEGMRLLAEVTEFIMVKLGHATELTAGSVFSKSRRTAVRAIGPLKGE